MERYYFIVYVIIIGLLGLCIGSFLNVVIYRLPNKINLAKPRSFCPTCHHKLAFYDNIPLFSYLFLKGKCRYCHTKISPRYFIIELINFLMYIFLAIYFYKDGLLNASMYCLMFSILLCIFMIDLKHLFIPDSLQISLLLIGLILLFSDLKNNYVNMLLGALVGFCFYLLFYGLSYLVFKKEGLGFGDVKLMGVSGLIIGLDGIIIAIIISSFISLIYVLISKKKNKEIPFAPFLVIGIMISLLTKDFLTTWYLNLL